MNKVLSLLLLSLAGSTAMAQSARYNKLPSSEAATYDNNGNDLRGFVKSNKTELTQRGNRVNEYSSNTWGYLQTKTVKVPSQNKDGDLNFYQSIDVTLALYDGPGGEKATWWGREYNQRQAPMVYNKVGDPSMVDMDNVKYTDITRELQTKKWTLVEYYDSVLMPKDLDIMLGNVLYIKSGTVKQYEDYKTIIDFYNGFLAKFSPVNDPLLENISYVTFVKTNNAKYVAYFNMVNGKLSGRLEALNITLEDEKPKYVNAMLKNLTGKEIYLYADKTFGMEKTIMKRAAASNMKVVRKNTTMTGTFN